MSSFPLAVYHALPAQIPGPSHLLDRPQTLEDDIQRLRARESMVVAAPREKNSYHPQASLQEEESKHAFLDGSDQQSLKLVVMLRDG
jgi:hypothetical protein